MEQNQVFDQARASRKLLIVDDEEKICRMLAQYFSLKGYEVRAVRGGEEALVLAAVFQPDVVLLDLLMPGLNGWETLDRLRAVPELADTPVVILTAKGSPYDRLVGENVARVSAYLSKPFRIDELREVIQKLL